MSSNNTLKALKHLIYTLLLLLNVGSLNAQSYTLKGTIRSSDTNEGIAFASILLMESNLGVSSDNNGDYTIILTPGSYSLKINVLGFEERMITININKNQSKTIFLTPAIYTVQEVTVGGLHTDKNVQQSRMSIVKLSPKSLKSMPAFMGEVDILKTIQLLPGVQSGGEGSTGFYVRGGGPDQNLILLDGATIYNASHLFGFFSVFNADAIDNVELYKGGMPAEYGGRISSILDIEMQDGDMQEFKGSGGIGSISTRLSLQGPIKKDTASFLFSARRTYIDALVMPFVKNDSPFKGSGYFFYDLNGKITYRLNDKNTLFFSAYYGKDKFSFVQKRKWPEPKDTLG